MAEAEAGRRVLVLGGGLAGMTAALELARAGAKVTLIERAAYLGGKAGVEAGNTTDCNPAPGARYEHGYHIFAPWYENVFELLDSAGVQRVGVEIDDPPLSGPALLPVRRWYYLDHRDGEKLALKSWRIPRSLGGTRLSELPEKLAGFVSDMIEVVGTSPLPPIDTMLYFYFILDMVGEPLLRGNEGKQSNRRAALDRVTRLGLLRKSWYKTDLMPLLEGESMLKATAIPVHEMSAFTAKRLTSHFLYNSSPPLWALNCDLHEGLIAPIERMLDEQGVEIRKNTTVTKIRFGGFQLDEVTVENPDGSEERLGADAFIFALPLDVADDLLGADLYRLDPKIANLAKLRVAPMAQLEVPLKDRIPRLPQEHVFLSRIASRVVEKDLGMSFIDQSGLWSGHDDKEFPHRLAIIAADFAPLRNMEPHEQFELMMHEIGKFLPISVSDVAHWNLSPNTAPGKRLFINSVGSWPDRPAVTTALPNLFMAGDWVQNQVDLACMEGAVCAGRDCARATSSYLSKRGPVSLTPEPLPIPKFDENLVRLLTLALSPIALGLKIAASIRDTVGGAKR